MITGQRKTEQCTMLLPPRKGNSVKLATDRQQLSFRSTNLRVQILITLHLGESRVA